MPMTRYSDYYFFRYFILPAVQISFNFEDDQSELKPKDRIKRAIDVLEEKRKITEVFKNRKYLLYFSKGRNVWGHLRILRIIDQETGII